MSENQYEVIQEEVRKLASLPLVSTQHLPDDEPQCDAEGRLILSPEGLQPGDVVIRSIDKAEQRYPTSGDWWTDENGVLHIRVSEMGNLTYSLMVAIHELAEWIVCSHTGVTEKDVDDWDMDVHPGSDDPGDEPGCPYQQGHNAGVAVERMLCAVLGIDWHTYNQAVEDATPVI